MNQTTVPVDDIEKRILEVTKDNSIWIYKLPSIMQDTTRTDSKEYMIHNNDIAIARFKYNGIEDKTVDIWDYYTRHITGIQRTTTVRYKFYSGTTAVNYLVLKLENIELEDITTDNVTKLSAFEDDGQRMISSYRIANSRQEAMVKKLRCLVALKQALTEAINKTVLPDKFKKLPEEKTAHLLDNAYIDLERDYTQYIVPSSKIKRLNAQYMIEDINWVINEYEEEIDYLVDKYADIMVG